MNFQFRALNACSFSITVRREAKGMFRSRLDNVFTAVSRFRRRGALWIFGNLLEDPMNPVNCFETHRAESLSFDQCVLGKTSETI